MPNEEFKKAAEEMQSGLKKAAHAAKGELSKAMANFSSAINDYRDDVAKRAEEAKKAAGEAGETVKENVA